MKTNQEGEKLNVTLHQSYLNAAPIGFTNLSNLNTFSIPCPTEPTFNASYTEFQIENIYAPNKSWVVEDEGIINVINITSSDYYFASFKPIGVGYLEKISVMVRETDVAQTTGLSIYLFNSENVSTRPRPYQQIGTTSIVDTSEIIGDTFYWHNMTNIHAKYNCSETFENTFFLLLDKESGGVSTDITFKGNFDNELGDNSDDTIVLDSAENPVRFGGIIRVDIALKLGFAPLDNTPTPSSINLRINNTNLSDIGNENQGSWMSFEEYSNPSGELEFELLADWWDVGCDITHAQINYTKTDLKASTTYEIPEPDLVHWNASIEEPINSFDSRTDNNNYIAFWVPENWSDIKAFNGNVEKPIDISLPAINGFKKVIVFQAENGVNWYLTAVIDNRIPGNGGEAIPFGNYTLLFTAIVVISLL
ncbi:MAG: hypothetical protein ACFFG0_36400, partial [Candidatus Thorarchaeota archaeon]